MNKSINTNDIDLKEQITENLLNHLYEGIYFVDNERKLRFWNKGAENITGYTSDEVLDKYCPDNILCHVDEHGKSLCHSDCPLVTSIEEGSYSEARVYVTHKNGTQIPVKIHVSPIKNKQGRIIGAVEIFTNDSDYEELKKTKMILEETNEMKNQLLGVAAHDLRSPLTVALSFSSLILDFYSVSLPQDVVLFIGKIKSACENMLLLINDLLDMTAIESGKVNLNRKKHCIYRVIDLENYSMKVIAEQKNIKIHLDIAQGIPDICVDKNRINQMMENLLSNSVKYSYSGTDIFIKVTSDKKNAIISVKDQGQGIPAIDLPLLFKPFQKASTKPTGKEKSSGLGLAIVKRIVDLHNGTIEIKSEQNVGTEFIISLPIDAN